MLDLLKQRPPRETDLQGLSAKDIIDKIDSFYSKDPGSHDEFAEGYFLQLLREYPVSMCTYNMTENLKLLIALVYFASKPKHKEKDGWEGYSYGDLALCFDRSKATIHQAITQKEAEAKALLASMQPKQEADEKPPSQAREEVKPLSELNEQKSSSQNEQSLSLCERG